MNKKQRATFIQKKLNELFPDPKISLKHSSAYTLLISVLLSAQCTDVRVNQITPLLFKKARTAKQMVRLKPGEIEAIIRPCGLGKNKSKAVWKLSKQLLESHQGEVPQTLEELEQLAGVGHKTASVVLCQAFEKDAFPVDTHIHRCAKRWKLSSGKNVVQTERDLKKLFPKKNWCRLHLQMIHFARTYCKAKAHDSSACPICSKII